MNLQQVKQNEKKCDLLQRLLSKRIIVPLCDESVMILKSVKALKALQSDIENYFKTKFKSINGICMMETPLTDKITDGGCSEIRFLRKEGIKTLKLTVDTLLVI